MDEKKSTELVPVSETRAELPPILVGRHTPPRLTASQSVALPRVGLAVQLRAVASGDDAGERGLEVPCRTTQPAPLPRLLAAEPVDLRVSGWIPLSTPPKSVTVSLSSLPSPTPGRRKARCPAARRPSCAST